VLALPLACPSTPLHRQKLGAGLEPRNLQNTNLLLYQLSYPSKRTVRSPRAGTVPHPHAARTN
jgi:hypothetical protein